METGRPAGGTRRDTPMNVLESTLPVRSDAFRSNHDRMRRLVEETSALAAGIMEGGPQSARARHVERGKLLPRERVGRLLDPGSPFLEIGLFAAHGMYGGEVPSAGLVTRHRAASPASSAWWCATTPR